MEHRDIDRLREEAEVFALDLLVSLQVTGNAYFGTYSLESTASTLNP